MSDTPFASSSSSASAYLLVPILLLFALLIIAVLRSPSLISSAGIGSAVIVTTPLVLATYALMAIAIAGRGTVDLSVGPLIGFINVTLVQLNGLGLVSEPLEVFAYAIAVGVAYQLMMGLIIVFVRVQPIIVSLSGYLALSGINLVVLARPGGEAPEWMMSWGAGTSIVSPVLVILVLCTAAWLLFARTAFYGHLRLMGSDERAAYTSGVRITIVRLGAHCIAGVFSALAALTFTSLIGSGDPTQGTTYTLIAVTALVLGGTSLAGGRGGAIGSLLGAVNLFLIGYVLATFSFGMVQGFVTDLAYGAILVLSLLLTLALPHVQRQIRDVSPFLVFVVLSLLFTGVMLHAKFDYAPRVALVPAVETPAGPAPASPPAVAPNAAAPTASVLDSVPTGVDASKAGDTPQAGIVSPSTSAPPLVVTAPADSAALPSVTPPVAAAPQRATPAAVRPPPRESFVFGQIDSGAESPSAPFPKKLVAIALLLVALVAILRIVVVEASSRMMTPLLYVSFILVIVLGFWLLADATPAEPQPAGATVRN